MYSDIFDINNIEKAFNEVYRNTKNRRKVALFREYKCSYISKIYEILESKSYVPGPYNIFTIYEPKERRIVSQGMVDKIINHLVSRHILYPTIIPCLTSTQLAFSHLEELKIKRPHKISFKYNLKLQDNGLFLI